MSFASFRNVLAVILFNFVCPYSGGPVFPYFYGELSSVLSCLIISNTCLCFINFVFVFLVLYTGSRASLQFSFIKALLACPLKSIVAESGWTYPQGKSVLFRMEGSCHDMWGPPQVLQSVLVPREVKVLIVVLLRR